MNENQLLLPSGKIITFNTEQFDGLKKINHWLKNGETFFTLAGYAGTGKEQPTDSIVQTPSGPIEIGKLRLGDNIFGANGDLISVDGIFPQGIKQAYKITFRDGTTTECGEDHLWEVWTHKLRQQKKSTITKKLKEIIESDITFKSGIHKFSIPLCKSVPYDEKILPIHPYLMGVLIGDGSLHGNSINISTPDIDVGIINHIKSLLDDSIEVVEDRSSSCPRYRLIDTNRVYKSEIKNAIRELKLNVKSISKFIPDIYKYSSIEQRWELLRGLMDTDGTSRGNRIGFSTSSLLLRNDVIELVQSLGGVAIINRDDERSENTNYSINVKTFHNPFKLIRKAEKWKYSTKNPPSRHIVDIKKSRICEQVCISVNSKDGLYLTDNYIVTHNTTIVKKVLDNYRYGVVVSAPTHKAKKVVMNTTGEDGATLHSLLGLRPDVDLDNFNPNDPKFNPIAIPKITDFNFVIIDEASMINQELYDLIIEQTKGSRTKVLFMGDPAQIPPVGEKASVVFQQDQTKQFHQLTKIERQNDTNPLAFIYDALRNNLNKLDGGFERKSVMNELGEGVIFTVDKREFRKAILDKFKSEEFQKNTDFAKVIAWKNDTVMLSNAVIREQLLGKDTDIVEVGDLLMGYRSVSEEKQRFNIIENSADYRVMKKESLEENTYGIMGYIVQLREDLAKGRFKHQDVFIVNTEDPDNLHLYAEMHDFFRDMGKSNKKNWKKYYDFRRNNLLMKTVEKYRNGLYRSTQDVIVKDLDYGFAITCHKAQGSTYSHVFVMENDMNDNWVLKERNQIKYVALTRPSMTATVLTTKLD
jgi:intein/homing endonuclease